MKITKQTLEAWTDALESGDYIQGSGCLKYTSESSGETQFCCLGVLAEIMGLDYEEADRDGKEENSNVYDDMARALINVQINSVDLITMNDTGETPFVEIAKYIKEEQNA